MDELGKCLKASSAGGESQGGEFVQSSSGVHCAQRTEGYFGSSTKCDQGPCAKVERPPPARTGAAASGRAPSGPSCSFKIDPCAAAKSADLFPHVCPFVVRVRKPREVHALYDAPRVVQLGYVLGG